MYAVAVVVIEIVPTSFPAFLKDIKIPSSFLPIILSDPLLFNKNLPLLNEAPVVVLFWPGVVLVVDIVIPLTI